jgi:hypothetical protein
LDDLISLSKTLDGDNTYNTSLCSIVLDLLDYGLVIEANSVAGADRAVKYSLIVNDVVSKGHGSEGMTLPLSIVTEAKFTHLPKLWMSRRCLNKFSFVLRMVSKHS